MKASSKQPRKQPRSGPPSPQGSLPLQPQPRRVIALQPYLRACQKLRVKEAHAFAAASKVHAFSYSRTKPVSCQLPFSVANRVSEREIGYWLNLDELVAACDEEDVPLPPYVWATKPRPRRLDAAQILEEAGEDQADLDPAAVEKLQALLDRWGQDHPGCEVDYSRAILLAESADPAHSAEGRAA